MLWRQAHAGQPDSEGQCFSISGDMGNAGKVTGHTIRKMHHIANRTPTSLKPCQLSGGLFEMAMAGRILKLVIHSSLEPSMGLRVGKFCQKHVHPERLLFYKYRTLLIGLLPQGYKL